VSARSADFAIGSFFDIDAPAREIQIALPLDTSPAGLRKFRKTVSFVLSDQLQKQMSAIKGLQETMDGDVGGQSWGIGFICSFSIPIITICAFFVLMIFLILLNIVFFWLPFFRICLPIPVKK
jgi:hypothetical protein